MGRISHYSHFTSAMTLRITLWMTLVTLSERWVLVINDQWDFQTQIDADAAFREYVFQETEPWAALLCPAGLFISQIDYFFTVFQPRVHDKNKHHTPPNRPTEHHPEEPFPPQGHPPPEGRPPQGHPFQVQPPQGHQFHGQPQVHPFQGQPPQGQPPQGQPPQVYPPQGHQFQGHPHQGQPPQGHPPQGHPFQGPLQGQLPQGYPPQGHAPEGLPPQGHPLKGLPQGYPYQGHPQLPPHQGQLPRGHPFQGQPPQGHLQGQPPYYPPPDGQQPQFQPPQDYVPDNPTHGNNQGQPTTTKYPELRNPWEEYTQKQERRKKVAEASKPLSTFTFSLFTLDAFHFARINEFRNNGRYQGDKTVNLNVKYNGSEIEMEKITALLDAGQFLVHDQIPDGYGPCASLVRCIGHQACTFRYSNDFCHGDPLPGLRKVLNIRIRCDKKYHYNTLLREYAKVAKVGFEVATDMAHWPDLVMFVKYKALVEKGIKTYNSTLMSHQTHMKDAFGTFCPMTVDAKIAGYHGNCSGPHPPPVAYTSHLWKILSRANDSKCRDELLQVFCAYHYHRGGHCTPPFLLRPGRTDFDHFAIPAHGKRFDLTKYNQIFMDPDKHLIPARIGFVICAHASPLALMELMGLIYKPQHFYVFHIDYRADSVRQELTERIQKTFPDSENIAILPKERSFASSWGCYQINRAQMECIEELLQMGVWDFTFIISGSDLPIRDIDDLALALAPHRDKNFLRFNKIMNTAGDTNLNSAWFGCGGHLFWIAQRQPREFELVSHSNWVILNREFTEFLWSEKGNSYVEDLQLYLMTTLIPDETYIGTIIYNSHFRKSLVRTGFHRMKPFEAKNADNLCRHSDETDTCGQGPTDYEVEDISDLLLQSDRFFMARKFKVDPEDKARKKVLNSMNKGYYYRRLRKEGLTDSLVRELAKMALVDRSPVYEIESLLRWQVVPSFSSDDPVCYQATDHSILSALNYRLVVDLSVLKDGRSSRKRLMSTPKLAFACFPRGHLRHMQISTRFRTNKEHKRREAFKDNVPIPSMPPGVMWLNIMFDVDGGEFVSGDQDYQAYFQVPPGNPPPHHPVLTPVTATIKDINGQVFCQHPFDLDMDSSKINQDNFTIFSRAFPECGNISVGFWEFTLQQKHPLAFPYQVVFHVAELGPSYEAAVKPYLRNLWRIDDMIEVNEQKENSYYEKIPKIHESPRMGKEEFLEEIQEEFQTGSSVLPGVGGTFIPRAMAGPKHANERERPLDSSSRVASHSSTWSFLVSLLLVVISSGFIFFFYSCVTKRSARIMIVYTAILFVSVQCLIMVHL